MGAPLATAADRPARASPGVAWLLGWQPLEGWRWSAPGQGDPLCFMHLSWPELQHRLRDSLRHHALGQLEARRPNTLSALGGALDREACLTAITNKLSGGTTSASPEGGRAAAPSGRAEPLEALGFARQRPSPLLLPAAGGHGRGRELPPGRGTGQPPRGGGKPGTTGVDEHGARGVPAPRSAGWGHVDHGAGGKT